MKLSLYLYFSIILVFYVFTFYGCSKHEKENRNNEITISDEDFKEEIILEGEPVEQVNEYLLDPKYIHVSDSLLVSVESNVENEIFKIFSLHDYSYLGSYGARGEGPEEFSQILSNTVQVHNRSNDNSIAIYDWSRKIISNFYMHTVLGDSSSPMRKNEYILPPELILAQRATFLNDTMVVAADGMEEGILAYANTKTDSVTYVSINVNKGGTEISNREIRKLNRAEFAISKVKGRIVLAMLQFPKINILDLKGNIRQVISFPLQVDPATQTENQRKLFYRDIKVTEDYIYAVYIGLTSEETEKIYENYISEIPSYSTEVHVFDWDGKPVRKLLLKDKFIPFIQVDRKNNQLLAIDVFSDSLSVLRFQSKLIE